ncbi:MAG: LON peptidase substrate-binding domain-containing protein [Rhizobacter sp.]
MAMPPPALSELPLFPLQSVLFPGGYLPLRIFEVRYLDMIGRSHKAGTPFGVVCLTEGREVRQPPPRHAPLDARGDGFANESFFDVGTLATITQLERPNPGLMTICCTGTQRFRIHGRERLKHGLWMAQAELLPDDVVVAVPHDLETVAATLQVVVRNLVDRADSPAEMPLQPPYRWDDCGWVANRWCELLPLGHEDKQRFMSLDNPLLRLELVADVLDQTGLAQSLSGKY